MVGTRVEGQLPGALLAYRFRPQAGANEGPQYGISPKPRPHWRLPSIGAEYGLTCAGEFNIIAPILGLPVIKWMLTHLGLQARTRSLAAVPGPTQNAA